MIHEGQKLVIPAGPFKGQEATITRIANHLIYVELELFGRVTPITLDHAQIGLPYAPVYKNFADLIVEFDHHYQRQAPQRYLQLRSGLEDRDLQGLAEKLGLEALPSDWIALYRWKDGMQDLPQGWRSEFAEGKWHETIPLDGASHWMSAEVAVSIRRMWQDILWESRAQRTACYWRDGFLPFLNIQSYGHSVIDTIGHFGGKPFQIVSFDYKCTNGYRIDYENLNKWLETKVGLLKRGLLFERNHAAMQVEREINGYFTGYTEIPLEAA